MATSERELAAQVKMVLVLIRPDLGSKEAVEEFFKRAPDLAPKDMQDYVTTLCKGYLEGMK
jgi:hypothetical protein